MNALDRSLRHLIPASPSTSSPDILAVVRPLPENAVVALSDQIEEELVKLERRFHEFVTQSSTIQGLGR